VTAGALPIGRRSATVLALVSLAGLAAFAWPLLIAVDAGTSHGVDAPVVFSILLPLLLGVLLAEFSDGGIDTRALAMLAVLAAVGAALRPLGAGTAGIETVFFLLILGGRVMGPGFGFLLGTTTLFASALVTGGVGPWLPFQMLAAGWVGLGAGLLPPARGRREIGLLVAYGIIAAYVYGTLMNLWFWPFSVGTSSSVSYVPGAPLVENLRRFAVYDAVTSLGWDTGRAITTTVLLLLAGPAVLSVLRRAKRTAAFDARPAFEAAPSGDAPSGNTPSEDGSVRPGRSGDPARTTAASRATGPTEAHPPTAP
jgi:energy-coupling factor transport system substrate-specific component